LDVSDSGLSAEKGGIVVGENIPLSTPAKHWLYILWCN